MPYLGFKIFKLERGQRLNQHRDCHKHLDYPNHIMNFGRFTRGSLQTPRNGVWHSYDRAMVWLSFDTLKVTGDS